MRPGCRPEFLVVRSLHVGLILGEALQGRSRDGCWPCDPGRAQTDLLACCCTGRSLLAHARAGGWSDGPLLLLAPVTLASVSLMFVTGAAGSGSAACCRPTNVSSPRRSAGAAGHHPASSRWAASPARPACSGRGSHPTTAHAPTADGDGDPATSSGLARRAPRGGVSRRWTGQWWERTGCGLAVGGWVRRADGAVGASVDRWRPQGGSTGVAATRVGSGSWPDPTTGPAAVAPRRRGRARITGDRRLLRTRRGGLLGDLAAVSTQVVVCRHLRSAARR